MLKISKYIFLRLLLMGFFYLLLPVRIFAANEFISRYDVSYEFDNQGTAFVNMNVDLENVKSQSYIAEYKLILNESLIKNISAYDSLGPLKVVVDKNNTQTFINLTFNQNVVGKGKLLKFQISFYAYGLAEKIGNVWEIGLPKINNLSEIDAYNLNLTVPISFGSLNSIQPKPIKRDDSTNLYIFYFNKEILKNNTIKAIFGPFQVYDFTLKYHLKNDQNNTIMQKITVPPDTEQQKVYYQLISKFPDQASVDNDGNWIFSYELKAKEKVDVILEGQVKIFFKNPNDYPDFNLQYLNNNLEDCKYWPVKDPLIKNLSNGNKTPRQIYDFVVNKLSYNPLAQTKERLGAVETLNKPHNSICTDFTDLFITLARASGIPAREIVGYAQTTDQKLLNWQISSDILHSWPEYFNNKTNSWIPVDPTWGKTTQGVDYFDSFDLNHFALVIHGQNCETPFPASFYKTNEIETKNILVSLGQSQEEPVSDIKIGFDQNPNFYQEFKNKSKIIIYNNGPSAVYNLNIETNKNDFQTTLPDNILINVLPPFANKEIIFENKPNLYRTRSRTLTIKIGEQLFTKKYNFHSWILLIILSRIPVASFLTFILKK